MIKRNLRVGQGVLVGTFKQDSPEWHEARAAVIGGSDIASVLGLSSWKSGYTLWAEKSGRVEPQPVSEDQQRKRDYGHYMEPFVAAQFAKAHPEYTVYETGSWRNQERPWQGCNPDRLLAMGDRPVEEATSLLQIKTANYSTDWEDGVPADYLAQVRWEMDTFGFPTGYLAVYFNVGGGYAEYEIKADPFDQEAVRKQALVFAESLTDDTPPEIDGLDSTYQTLRRMNPSLERGKEVVIAQDVALAYIGAHRLLKEVEKEATKWKGHLLAHMGTAQYAVYDGSKIASRVAQKDSVPYLKEA